MEKGKPHYRLAEIQLETRQRGAAAFTRTAIDNGLGMGLTVAEMIGTVCHLKQANFYKQ